MSKWDEILSGAAKTTCVTCRRAVQHEKGHFSRALVACSEQCAKDAADDAVLCGETGRRVARGARRYYLVTVDGAPYAVYWPKGK